MRGDAMPRLTAYPRLHALTAVFASLITLNSAFGNSIANCNADAILVFDASASMSGVGETRLSIRRIEEAREAVRHSLPDITPFRRVGLMIYGPGTKGTCDNIDLRFAPTANAAAQIVAAVDAIEPGGGTPLARAVQNAAEELDVDRDPGVIVLVTDGADTCGGQTCEVAASLAPTKVTVHVIGFRLPFDTLAFSDHTTALDNSDPASSQRKRLHTEIRCLADSTGGKFAMADDTDELVSALRDVLACPVVSDRALGTLRQPPSWKWS